MTTVCIDCRYIGPRPSGIAEVVQALVDFLPVLAPDLTFLLLKHPAHPAALSGATNVREVVVNQPANGPATMWWLSSVIDLSGIDLFHATFNIMPAGLPSPCVTTIHDIMWLTQPDLCSQGLWGQVERRFYAHGIERALRRSAAIATVSTATRNAIAAHAPFAASRTHTTLSGVSRQFRPVEIDRSILAALGVPAGKQLVLTVGQYAPYKNHEGALRAFALALHDREEFDLVLLQRIGRQSQRLLQLADELGIAGRVHLLRAAEREAMPHLYGAATVLLHPSFCEGFGNPLAEAMACGCPVVTSDVSAMPEVCDDAALFADPHDPAAIAVALRRVVDDPATAQRMRTRGLARAAELDWRAFAVANLAIYREVLAGSRSISSRSRARAAS